MAPGGNILKIAGREIEKPEFIKAVFLVLFLALLMAIVVIKALRDGLGVKDLLMGFGVFAIAVVMLCLTWPEKAQKIVRKNHTAIYAVFMLLIAPVFMILALRMASNSIDNCCSVYAYMQASGAASAIAAIIILSTEIVPYKKIISKIKKAMCY